MTVTSCIKYGLLCIAATLSTGAIAGTANASAELKRWLNHYVGNHPSVLAAQSAVDSAGYQLVAADKALFNPELELDAETAETDSAYVGLSQTIDWGDIRGARTERATSEKSAAQLAFESTRRDIATQLLAALADFHTTEALKTLAEQGNELMQRSARLAKQRFDAGDLGQVEVDLANLSYAQARFKLADAISAHARAEQNLIALTGSSSVSRPELSITFPAPDRDPGKVDKTVQQLPQMQEIIARVHAAQAQVKVRVGEKASKPTLAFRAGKEEQDTLLGVSFSVPLKVRNNFQAEVDAANAQMIQAEKESIDAYRRLKSRLEIAAVSYELSREAWQAWQRSGEGTLGEQIKLLERLWKAGEINTTDYLIQLTQALNTKASALEQRGRMWTDWSEWLLASGQIEQWLAMQAQDQKQ
ncbi:MAG TPA: TolC family protein [Gammaproteobacteria bacterium]|nr:TolC family protein [Gammaproteobacteria bacterium]